MMEKLMKTIDFDPDTPVEVAYRRRHRRFLAGFATLLLVLIVILLYF